MEDLSSNIKKVMIIFLLLFVALISYFAYFVAFKGEAVASKSYNRRLWDKRNKVLRGTIFDRDGKVLSKSEKTGESTQKREFTGGAVFSHVLGYFDTKYGMSGLEFNYDSVLTGRNELSYFQLWKSSGKENEKGNSIKTTLNSKIQQVAYDQLGDKRGSVVVLNPQTGEVLAMVSKPTYDPNTFGKDYENIIKNNDKPLINRSTSGLYPPGSIFKTVTAVSALENMPGIDSRTIQDKGKLVFNSKYSLSNFDGHVYGNIDIKKAFTVSSNVFFGTMAMELKNDKLKDTAEKFFFNKDIKGEGLLIENSRFPTLSSSQVGDIAQSGIGQSSVLVTPMEMALVASTIANDGVMMRPMLVSDILKYDGTVEKTIKPEKLVDVTTKEIASKVKSYMRNVVVEGTAKAAAVSGVEISGKTGTADHDNNNKEPHSWFIGFGPYENPTVAVAVIVEEGGTGGGAASKIASNVFKAALK